MEYQKLFRETVEELSKKYKNIIVCGGTGLYIRASIYDYVFNQEEDNDVSDLEALDNDTLYEMLKELDPRSLDTIHKNNRKRVIRAISIARRSGQTKSETIDQQEHKLIYENLKILMLNPNREDLYAHINQRVDIMFEKGLVEEVKSLKNRFNLSVTAKEAIGYKEVLSYLDGELTLEECKELIKKRTRNYAKRQVTFFKNQFSLKMYQDVHELVLDNTKER
jgi:tRNA dimethylallyltransferase